MTHEPRADCRIVIMLEPELHEVGFGPTPTCKGSQTQRKALLVAILVCLFSYGVPIELPTSLVALLVWVSWLLKAE